MYPVFVKPARSGSSFGVTRVDRADELDAAIAAAREYDSKVLIEQAVVGTEVGCAVLGNGADLFVGEVDQITLRHGIFRIHQEAEPELGSENAVVTVPADLPAEKRDEIRATARTIYVTLGCEGLARVDMFLQEDGRIVLNEVNTLPGFTTYSRYPRMMAAVGLGRSRTDRPAHLVGDGAVIMERGFVFLDEVLSGVRWDAKYATWDNFTGTPVEGYEVNRIVGSYALADALLEAKRRAAALGFGLLLWDGYRPQRAVNRFLEWSAQPEDGRMKERFYPNIDRAEMFSNGYVAPRSGHSRGSAVDLTLYRLDTGEVAAMGGGHDLMDERSHHGATGVSGAEAENRRSLCSIMEASGFARYQQEWWHYVLSDEPYPDTYFDFPIL